MGTPDPYTPRKERRDGIESFLHLAASVAAFAQTGGFANPGSSSGPRFRIASRDVAARPDFRFRGRLAAPTRIRLTTFPQLVRPPKGAPNVLLILLDDAGYGQFSAFGGGVPSPEHRKNWLRKAALHAIPYEQRCAADARRIAPPQPSCFRNRFIKELPQGMTGIPGSSRRVPGTVF